MSRSVSVILPNYNGEQLLRQYLPCVIAACRDSREVSDYEIIVADDASTDNSVAYLRTAFPKEPVQVICSPTNNGFSVNANRGIRQAQYELVFMLNTDMQIDAEVFDTMVPMMSDDVFGVFCAICDPKDGHIQEGQKILAQRHGRIGYTDCLQPNIEGESMYLCGGNALIDRQKLLALGGYNELYAPFYFEDMDLSLRAWQHGWRSLYTGNTHCLHQHSATINTHYTREYIASIFIRNRILLNHKFLPTRQYPSFFVNVLYHAFQEWVRNLAYKPYRAALRSIWHREAGSERTPLTKEVTRHFAHPQPAILHYIASPFWGGGEQYVYNMALALSRQGQRLVFVCQPKTEPMLLERLQQLGDTYTLTPHTKNGKFSLLCALQLARIIRKHHVSVVHVHELKDFFISAYAKLLTGNRINLVATRHLVQGGKNRLVWRWCYRQFNHFIFVSQLAADSFFRPDGIRPACRQIHVVHNSIYLPPETPTTDIRRTLHLDATLPLVLYHGRVCREKGIVQLLQHLEQQPQRNFILLIAGDMADDCRTEFEQLLHHSTLSGHLVYLGFRTDIPALIRQCAFGVLPSVVQEAGPLALLEHMACASPIISSNNGCQPEFIHNGVEGILCAPGDWSAWSEAMQQLIAHPNQAKRIGENARKRFERDFNYPLFLQQIQAIYRQN